jgi:hypothetical protein
MESRVCGESGITTMRITQLYDSKEARDGAIACGMDQGMEACYQQLDALLAQSAYGKAPSAAASKEPS